MRSKQSTLVVLSLLCIGLLLGQAASAVAAGIPDYRFGVVEAYAAPSSASALGAGWERATFEWARIQPDSPEEWNILPLSDGALGGELSQGRQVVGLLITIPHWAIDPGTGLPQGLYLPADDPGNLWAGFVRTIVGRYAGRIDHWIIWNEPEIPRGSPDASWPGSIPDFLQLLRVAHGVAKSTNPGAVIHMAAVSHYHDPDWYNRFLEALIADPNAAANNYYFDVASLNLYHEPEKIFEITGHYLQMLHGKGVVKPLWITETNAYLSRVSEVQQAIFMVQAFSLEIAAGASRIAVYKMIDTETDQAADPEPFGLVQADGSRRPAFTAYRTAATHLSGFRAGVWERRDNISVVVVDRGSRTTTVVWARTPEGQIAEIPARASRAFAVDVWGSGRTIYPQDGRYIVELGGADCSQGCVLGGPPVMLVEEAASGSGAEPPAASPTRPPVGDVGGDEESGEAVTSTLTTTPRPTRVRFPTWTPRPSPTRTRRPTVTPTPSATPTSTPTETPIPTEPPTPAPSRTPPPAPVATPVVLVDEGDWRPLGVGLAIVAAAGGSVVLLARRRRARNRVR